MNNEFKDYLRKWLIKANNDLTVAKREMQNESPITDIVCFHCQQAVEKFLKSFLIFKEIEVGRTHDVDALLKQCCKIDPDFCDKDLKDLNFFGVSVRYPDDFYIPTVEETEDYLELAGDVKDIVEKKLEDISFE